MKVKVEKERQKLQRKRKFINFLLCFIHLSRKKNGLFRNKIMDRTNNRLCRSREVDSWKSSKLEYYWQKIVQPNTSEVCFLQSSCQLLAVRFIEVQRFVDSALLNFHYYNTFRYLIKHFKYILLEARRSEVIFLSTFACIKTKATLFN